MSATLDWSLVPVDPESMGGSGHPFKGIIIGALEQFGGFYESFLKEDGVVIRDDDPAAIYLRGVLAGMPVPREEHDTTDRDVLFNFLEDLRKHGSLLLKLEY